MSFILNSDVLKRKTETTKKAIMPNRPVFIIYGRVQAASLGLH